MRNHLLTSILVLVFGTAVAGIFYPLLVTAGAWTFFRAEAGGSLIESDGHVIGSVLLGRRVSDPACFWSRPSAMSPPYGAAASAGSNFGPTSPALADSIRARVARLRAADPGNAAPIPVDLVTASASGLDPHISPAAALFQVPRVARHRRLDPGRVEALVHRYVEPRQFGFLGEPRVNVLRLNLALDSLNDGR